MNEVASPRYEWRGAQFCITFSARSAYREYLGGLLFVIERTGVELLRIDTGSDRTEEAFLHRLEDARMQGFMSAVTPIAAREWCLQRPDEVTNP